MNETTWDPGKVVDLQERLKRAPKKRNFTGYKEKRKYDYSDTYRKDKKKETIRRACLGCGDPFDADGKFNRLCDSCNRSAW